MVDSNGDDLGDGGPQAREMRDIAAQAMIDAFGGIRPMAAKLGIPVSTVQGWKQRDTIPGARVGLVESAAAEHGIALPASTPASIPAAGSASPPGGKAAEAPPPASTASGRDEPMPQKAVPSAPPARPSAMAGSATARGTGRPRPGLQFSPASETAERPAAASGQRPANAPPAPPGPTPPPRAESPPPDDAPAGRGYARGAIVLAAVALVVALVWPFVFNAWLGADADDGGQAAGVEALAERIAALEQAPAADLSALQTDVDGLRAALDALPSGAADDTAVAALGDRLAALEQAAQGVGAAVVPAEVAQGLDALQVALDRLGQAVEGIEGRVATVETALAQIEAGDQGAAVDALRGTIAGLESSLATVRESLDGMAASAEAARADLLAGLEARLDERAGALERRIAALAGTDKVAAAHQSFLIALGQLGARLRTPQPFADELAALRQIAAGDDSLAPAVGAALNEGFAPVEDAASTGVTTFATLHTAFDETRRAVLGAVGAPPEDMLDEIWSELGGMVTVQRLEGAGADSVDAILAAAETALQAGDLASAANAMAGLEDHGAGPAEAAAPWLDAARLRIAADAAVEAVYRAAMTSFRPDDAPNEDTPTGDAPADDSPAGSEDAAPAPDAGASD